MSYQSISKSVKLSKDTKKRPNHKKKYNRVFSCNEIRIEVPYIKRSEKYPVKKLKNELTEAIVKNRIFKNEDIQELFYHTKKVNSHLDEFIINDAINLVNNDFDE